MRIPFDTAIWPSDAPAASLRLNALLEGHEMSAWAIVDTPPYDMPHSGCAGCDYTILATREGNVCYTPSIFDHDIVDFDQVFLVISPCDTPTLLGEDVRLRLLGQPELFEEARI